METVVAARLRLERVGSFESSTYGADLRAETLEDLCRVPDPSAWALLDALRAGDPALGDGVRYEVGCLGHSILSRAAASLGPGLAQRVSDETRLPFAPPGRQPEVTVGHVATLSLMHLCQLPNDRAYVGAFFMDVPTRERLARTAMAQCRGPTAPR